MKDVIKARHSVRSYLSKKIAEEIVLKLQEEISKCNQEGNLNIQLVTEDPNAFTGFLAHYGKFDNVQNYIALIGNKSSDLDERIGYYGERLVLLAQSLGLNTCWVAMTMKKGHVKQKCHIEKGQKLVCVLALGYGKTQGLSHKVKSVDQVCDDKDLPKWYLEGIHCALLAPTSMNQQKFKFSRKDNQVHVKATGGFYSKVDLGIVKYHFEIGAGKDNFTWM